MLRRSFIELVPVAFLGLNLKEKETKRCFVSRGNFKYYFDENNEVYLECENGEKRWYKNGKLHRDDGPATECSNGSKYWYQNGEFHRDDGPAIEYTNGNKSWYKNGLKLEKVSNYY